MGAILAVAWMMESDYSAAMTCWFGCLIMSELQGNKE
jgi:hypothetical protein